MVKIISSNGEYWLHDNGVNIVTANENIIDWHNECIVSGIEQANDHISLEFTKDADYEGTGSSSIRMGQKMTLEIRNLMPREFSIPDDKNFEGIYDFTGTSLSLCVGSQCFLLNGSQLELTLEMK